MNYSKGDVVLFDGHRIGKINFVSLAVSLYFENGYARIITTGKTILLRDLTQLNLYEKENYRDLYELV